MPLFIGEKTGRKPLFTQITGKRNIKSSDDQIVIPVLLSWCVPRYSFPFMLLVTGIDLRGINFVPAPKNMEDDSFLDLLEWGITGKSRTTWLRILQQTPDDDFR
jgi:hypothetical protein